MIGNTHSICLVLPIPFVLALFAGSVAHADAGGGGIPSRIEVFTTADFPMTRDAELFQRSARVADPNIYELDGMRRIEAKLSEGLTANPEQAKRLAMQRIQLLDRENRTQMQQAAIGLAKAVQYGVDRYPAIVFDGVAVVYGVTDIREALHRYRRWREGRKP